MRIYKAKKDIIASPTIHQADTKLYCYKGTMFNVDSYTDLPAYNDGTSQKFKEYWQELELVNHFGTVKLQGRM